MNLLKTIIIFISAMLMIPASALADGITVQSTAYNNLRGQTDSTPNTPACGGSIYGYRLPQLALNPNLRKRLGINKCFAVLDVNGVHHIVTDVKGAGGADKLIPCPRKGSCHAARRAAKEWGRRMVRITVVSRGE